MNQTQTSNPIDPFKGQSILSLNPRSFRDSKDSVDIEAIHQHMNSMALQIPDKHFEQAKSIIEGDSQSFNIKENEDNTKDKENAQERRPGLGRRRAKFTMKPDTSQPSAVVEPILQLDHLQEPEEFFAAFEAFENTKKELNRQRGIKEIPIIPTTARVRRPEIPRRKVTYKHHVYSSQSQNDELFSQETLKENIESPIITQRSQQEPLTPNEQSNEEEVAASITKTEEKLNKLFDELMYTNMGDGNGGLSLLKDRLNLKTYNIDTLKRPEFHSVHEVDYISPVKTSVTDQIIVSRKSLLEGIKEKTIGKQKNLQDYPFSPLASPTPPKSPFQAISTFGKKMLQSIGLNDPFSAHDIDSNPTTSSNEIIGGNSVLATLDSVLKNKINETAPGGLIDSSESEQPLNENSHSEPLNDVEDREECRNVEKRNVDESFVAPVVQTNEGVEGNVEDVVQKEASIINPDSNVEDITDRAHTDCVQDSDENVEDVTEKARSLSTSSKANIEVFAMEDLSQSAETGANSIEDLDANIPTQVSDIVPEQQNEEQPKTSNKRKKTTKKPKVNKKKMRKSLSADTGANSNEGIDANIPAQIPDIVPEQQNEEQSMTSVSKKKKTTKKSKMELRSRRQSLADAGSLWTSGGVRKSNRIRRKPLEYWRGERLLYGRVHNTLPTLIGVKYISPSKPGFKVESFVDAKYKDLVDSVALH